MKRKWLLAAISLILVSAMAAAYFALHTPVKPQAPAPTPEECKQRLEEVKQLRAELARVGLEAFITNSALPQVAPHIHSQWWVDQLPKDEVSRRLYEQEVRDFGLDIVGKIEAGLSKWLAEFDLAKLQEQAEVLLAISHWISQSPGYGNFIIRRWTEDLATVMIARMAINPECSFGILREYSGRLCPWTDDAYIQVAILNEEAPHTYEITGLDWGALKNQLERQWGKNSGCVRKFFKQKTKGFPRYEEMRGEYPQEAFYLSDDLCGNPTIRDVWSRKRHEAVCVYGMHNSMRRDLEHLLEYRERVGIIPDPSAVPLATVDEQDRFRDLVNDRWVAEAGKDGRPVGPNYIGSLVLDIYQGRCVDVYTGEYLFRNHRKTKR